MTGTSGRAALAFGKSSRPVIPGMLMSERIRINDAPPHHWFNGRGAMSDLSPLSGSSGSQTSAPAHQRAAGGVLARQPEILFARHTLPPAAGEELRPLFGPHSATDHRTTAPRSPRMAAMRAAPPSSLR